MAMDYVEYLVNGFIYRPGSVSDNCLSPMGTYMIQAHLPEDSCNLELGRRNGLLKPNPPLPEYMHSSILIV